MLEYTFPLRVFICIISFPLNSSTNITVREAREKRFFIYRAKMNHSRMRINNRYHFQLIDQYKIAQIVVINNIIYIFSHHSRYLDHFLPMILAMGFNVIAASCKRQCLLDLFLDRSSYVRFSRTARGRLLGEIERLKFCERVVKTCVLHFQLPFGTSSVSLTIIIFNESQFITRLLPYGERSTVPYKRYITHKF